MEFMVINPTWNVPRSITVKEYLPMLQQNPNAAGHLQDHRQPRPDGEPRRGGFHPVHGTELSRSR